MSLVGLFLRCYDGKRVEFLVQDDGWADWVMMGSGEWVTDDWIRILDDSMIMP